ncbi:MAG: type I methionyl aminopeptidase [Ignavibacteriales bacterium]|nr:type I methionyl aminopeptidase [Ignavibacteriales bacterium]HOJ17818.1 type I methionyl aminopeptidase [Ignavibacteriaceae bacterium]HPO55035.1 type I methionyl aminopeptidase [Ignavibacteriaceae bacterium]
MILIKTIKEIDFIRESCKIVAQTLETVKKNAYVGVTTKELDMIAEDFIESKSGKAAFKGYRQRGTPPFPSALCISINEEVVHGIPSSRKLKDGDIVSIDVGVLKEGYYGDAALSFIVGSVKPECERLLQITEESLYKGIEEARCDNRVEDISFAIQDHVEANGYSVVRELTGHGVGRFLHEDPSIPNFGKKGRGSKLRSGMTLAIEPMVNMGKKGVHVKDDGWTIAASDGLPSAHFEHTILVANKEAEILTVT